MMFGLAVGESEHPDALYNETLAHRSQSTDLDIDPSKSKWHTRLCEGNEHYWFKRRK